MSIVLSAHGARSGGSRARRSTHEMTSASPRLPSRLIPHRHRPRAELLPAYELQVDTFDSPANNVGPCPASLGCTTNSYSSINPSSVNASGSSRLPRTVPYPTPLELFNGLPRSPRTSSAFQSTRSRVLDTTYFFAASNRRRRVPSNQAALRPAPRPPRCLSYFVGHPAKEEGIGLSRFSTA